MAISVYLRKTNDDTDRCVYTFGSGDTSAGRVSVDKRSGDIELIELSESDGSPDGRFLLGTVVPRLQAFQEQQHFPSEKRWTV